MTESERFICDDLVREFDIELLDDHMARSLAARHDPRNMEEGGAAA